MKRYRVSIPYACWVTVDVEAENEEEAIEAAFDNGAIGHFCGNGGNDKLIGVYGDNVSIDVDDESIDGIADFKIEIDEL